MILMRKVAFESIVLLRNEGEVLPQKIRKIAIIRAKPVSSSCLSAGPAASAALRPSHFDPAYDRIVSLSAVEQEESGTEVPYRGIQRFISSLFPLHELSNFLIFSSP